MRSRTLQVFLACALGAGIGSLIALRVHPYFWWVGLLVGAAIGYLSYEFTEVLKAIGTAAVAGRRTAFAITKTAAFTLADRTILCPGFRMAALRLCLAVLSLIALASSLTLLCMGLRAYTPWPIYDQYSWTVTVGVWGVSVMLVAFVGLMWCAFAQRLDTYRVSKKELGLIALSLTPPGLVVLAGVLIVLTLCTIPRVAKFCVMFTKILFLTIHSDIRLLCGMYAFLGALVGFLVITLINPIIGTPAGALAGGGLGILTYKLIYQRLLRLQRQNG